MAQNTIAIITDCDDTLALDTTGQVLREFGIDSEQFFRETAEYVKRGWDPVLAYLYHMVELAQDGGPLADLTEDRLSEIGRTLEFYPGVPNVFRTLKSEIEGEVEFRDVGIRIETYVISSGIEQLLEKSSIMEAAHSLWGCAFEFDREEKIKFPRRAISFTDKTRYVYVIQKGLVGNEFRSNPFVVNIPMAHADRPVPFENMIYIGDSAGDIPCMSLIQANGGSVIGIWSDENPGKTWALAYGRRANLTVRPEFKQGGMAYQALRQALLQIATDIRRGRAFGRPRPRF